MRKMDNKGAMILLGAVVLIVALMGLELIFYGDNLPNQKDIDQVKKDDGGFWNWISGGLTSFISWVVDGLGALYDTLSFKSDLLVNLGVMGSILGMMLWALIIIGLIDILWIG